MVRRIAPLALVAVVLMGSASTRYRAGINPTVASHLEYAAQAAKDGRSGEAGGYAQALLIGEEITYALAFEPESEAQRETALKALETAAETWRTALDGSVTVRPVRDGETPNLVIHFQPDVQVEGRAVSGFIRWRREVQRTGTGWEGRFEGQIYARTQFKGRAMGVDAMTCCLGHEMGHMFGLPDAAGRDAIMGPLNFANPTEAPNESEIETVRNIREDAGTIGRLAMSGTAGQAIIEIDGAHDPLDGHLHDHDR